MNLGGLDIASVTGAAVMRGKKITTETFRAAGKKRFLDRDDDKSLDSMRMGEAGRSFEDFVTAWLIENEIGYVAIESPLPSNFERKKTVVDAAAEWAGQGIRVEREQGSPLATWFKLYGLEFIACSVCSRLNIPSVFVSQGTWRKTFIGTGRPQGGSAGAKRAAKAMCEKMGIECSSLDAAEACGVVYHLNILLNPYGARANDLFKTPA